MSEPWSPLRDVPVPLGARERVRRAIDTRHERPPPRRRAGRWALATVAVGGVALASVVAVQRRAPSTPPRPIDVPAGERVAVDIGGGRASVVGPARAEVRGGALHLRDGAVETLGALVVHGPQCRAELDGSAQITVRGDATMVRVFAGYARVDRVDPLCEVIELPAPASSPASRATVEPVVIVDGGVPDAETVVAAEPSPDADLRSPAPRPAASAPHGGRPAAPSSAGPRSGSASGSDPGSASDPEPASASDPGSRPSLPDPLSEQVAAYRAATAAEARAPTAAVAAWADFLVRWPRASLTAAAELRLIALLGRLDRRHEQRAAGERFLVRHPDHPRAAEVRRLVEVR